MATLSFANHTTLGLSPSFPPQIPRTQNAQTRAFSPRSSNSQLHGIGSSIAFPPASPRSSSGRCVVVSAKVNQGQAPPPFTLKDQDGKNVSLSVYFYPADETPGCTKQACAFRDSYEKFKKAGAEVVGISGDGSASHKVIPN